MRNSIRRFNQRVFNRLVLTFAGRRLYAVIRHTGRRSGRTYTTPVVAWTTSTGFIIPLSFGRTTDWYRNVVAAGRCTIQLRNRLYPAGDPQLIDRTAVLQELPPCGRTIARLVPVHTYLRLRRLDHTS